MSMFQVETETEVIGQVIRSIIMGLGREAIPILKKYGIADPQPDQWYPLHQWLGAMYELSSGSNPIFDLVAIGMKIVETALFPPHVNSIPAVMEVIDIAYHMNHRNGEIGHYQVEQIAPRKIKVVAKNPYPDFFDYGLLYGMAKKFLPPDGHLMVEHDNYSSCREHGGAACTYYISW